MPEKKTDKYLNWFAKYIGVQGILAVGFFIIFAIMMIGERQINPEFWGILGIIIGFYFAKNGHEIIDLVNSKRKDH